MKNKVMDLSKFIEDKLISVQKHPTEDLFIYNYTQKAQFDRVWTEETMMCRGLILDGNKNIVARPFKKFFNLQEAVDAGEKISTGKFVVQEKFDGSLGILYWVKDQPYIATRGSFVSDQAIEGNKILQGYSGYFGDLNRNYTYLFEIIYPENRIVVDYDGRRDLILLAVIDTQSGKEMDIYKECSGFPVAGLVTDEYLDFVKSAKSLVQKPVENKEGYVIKFVRSGKRYKIKFDEYVRLHRLITGVNARRIWDLLRHGESLDELLERVPDEFFKWVKDTKDGLEKEYQKWFDVSFLIFSRVSGMKTRREQAEFLKDYSCKDIVFKLLDGKEYSDLIWKKLKPAHEQPFKLEI